MLLNLVRNLFVVLLNGLRTYKNVTCVLCLFCTLHFNEVYLYMYIYNIML